VSYQKVQGEKGQATIVSDTGKGGGGAESGEVRSRLSGLGECSCVNLGGNIHARDWVRRGKSGELRWEEGRAVFLCEFKKWKFTPQKKERQIPNSVGRTSATGRGERRFR